MKKEAMRDVKLFVLISFLYSWPIMFCVDGWLEPMFTAQNRLVAARYAVLFGHMVAMLGPALAALFMWRRQHKETPSWSWGKLRHYGLATLAMFIFWSLPGLLGLVFGDTLKSPLETQAWIRIGAMLILGWITGIGEEMGWCAYLLPRLSPLVGKARALVISGVIRGLWHWPVLISPIIAQVITGERNVLELMGAGIVIAVQLAVTNVLFGSLLGWIWYRTESIPLVGWTHYWHNLTRDVTTMALVGYGNSLWATQLYTFILYPLAFILLDQVLKEEGLNWQQFFKRIQPEEMDNDSTMHENTNSS
jgi:membrane protease YdiL (CAAX protease family)